MTEQYAIHIMVDQSPANPFEEWDSEPPILVAVNDRFRNTLQGYGLDPCCPDLPEEVVRKHWPTMLDRLNYTPDWEGLRNFAYDVKRAGRPPLWQDLADAYAEGAASQYDQLEEIAEAYEWLGLPTYVGTTHGYSQGDSAEVLVVWTQEWMDKMGIDLSELTPEQVEEAMQGTVRLYGAWAWGDVYGWAVTKGCVFSSKEDVPVVEEDYGHYPDDVIESCWGYYGTDHEETGLLPEARAIVELLQERDRQEAEERAYWEARGVMTVGV